LGQLAPHCPLVLWPSSLLAAKIKECPDRHVDGSSQPEVILGMRRLGTRGTILFWPPQFTPVIRLPRRRRALRQRLGQALRPLQ
jgi:hypothetical protein